MTLSITQEAKVSLGGILKLVVYRVVDAGPGGGELEVSLNHICWANGLDITNGGQVTVAWTDDSETITLGAAGSDGAIVRVTVIGWGG